MSTQEANRATATGNEAKTPGILREIAVSDIRCFVKRNRDKVAHQQLAESIRMEGLKVPVQVRDISQYAPADRKDPDTGETVRYELVCGQGRLEAFRLLGLLKIPAIVVRVESVEVVGRFLAENIIRRDMTWMEKGQLINRELERGRSVAEIAKGLHLSTGQLAVYRKVLTRLSRNPNVQAAVAKLSLDEAKTLATLDQASQDAVIEVVQMEEIAPDDVKQLVERVSRAQNAGKPLSVAEITGSLRALKTDLEEQRALRKQRRLHFDLGPAHLLRLLQNPVFCSQLDRMGIAYDKFVQTATNPTS